MYLFMSLGQFIRAESWTFRHSVVSSLWNQPTTPESHRLLR